MATTISPNMNLIVPVVGVEPGPQWASDLNASLSLIDSHNHSSGQGNLVQPNGLNINADLTFQNNNAINLRSARFTPQSANISLPTDLGCLYEVVNDLWYNDGAGNQIRITQGGSIVGSSGNITGLVPPASASYVGFPSFSFIWQSNIGVPATMDMGSIIIRDMNSPYDGITIQAPALSANYSITLPVAPPPVQSFMTMDASGDVAAPWTVDNTTIKIVANQLVAQSSAISIQGEHSWELNGNYGSLSFPQVNIDSVFFAPYNITIQSIWIYNGTLGTGLGTHYDLQVASPGGSYSSILSSPGIISPSATNDIWTDSGSIVGAHAGVIKPVIGTANILAGQALRFDISSAMSGAAADARIRIFYIKT